MVNIRFCEDFASLASLWSGGVAPVLFPVDPNRLDKLFNPTSDGKPSGKIPEENHQSLNALRQRMPARDFSSVLASLHVLLRYGQGLFPGFACIFGEFARAEWSSLVGYHKGFHRDHVIHQPQVALVVKKLFEDLRFDGNKHSLAAEMKRACWLASPGGEHGTYSLLDLAAFLVAQGRDSIRYLVDYARDLEVDARLIQPETLPAFLFWRCVIYDAAVTAALYHDIGYPIQFLQSVARKMRDGHFSGLMQGMGSVDVLDELFSDPLFRYPFRGYRSQRGLPLTHAMAREERAALEEAMNGSHGLPGAITFLELNHRVMAMRHPRVLARGRLVLEMAAQAMVMHDMQKVYRSKNAQRPYMRLAFLHDPVSFVVTLADQIQHYGRFNARFCPLKQRVSWKPDRVVLGCQAQGCEQGRALKVTLMYDNNHLMARFLQETKYNPSAQTDYFNPDYGYLDYASLYEDITFATSIDPGFCP